VTPRDRLVLPNGLTVLAASARAAPVFTAMLVVEAGSRFDPSGREGLAALTGAALLEGSVSRPAAALARVVDTVGSSVDSVTGYETCTVVASGLVEHCGETLEILCEMATSPAFERVAVEDCVRRHLAELADDEGQAYDVCRRDFMQAVFPGHPRGNPVAGSPESVTRLANEDVAAFHAALFRPANAVLAVAGDADAGRLLETAAACFEGWRGGGPELAGPPAPNRRMGRRVESVEMDASQVHVSFGGLGIKRSDPLFYAASVMDVVLGDSAGFGSRLSTKLREERGLAYVIESDATGSAGIDPGVFWAYTATSPGQFEPLVRGVMDELVLIRTEPPSEDELRSAIGYLIGRDLLDRETSDALAGRLVHAERHALGDDFDARYPSIVESVTRDDVLEAARSVIDLENCSLVTVGPVTPTDDLLPGA
jgi:zinc protease